MGEATLRLRELDRRAVAVGALLSVFCGCTRAPTALPLPEQRKLLVAFDPGGPTHFLAMNHPALDRFVVRDIYARVGGVSWRWSGKRPAVRLRAPLCSGLYAMAEFAVVRDTFEHTGPISVELRVNRQSLGWLHCAGEGTYRIQKSVPRELLVCGGDNVLTLSVDKTYQPPGGQALGVILLRMGFVD